MPIPAVITAAAENYKFNSDFLANTVKDLKPEEWFVRPNKTSNHAAWIVGHVIWARKGVLARLGTDWSQPWLGLFARGAALDEAAAYPSGETLLQAWRDVSAVLAGALERVSEDALSQPAVNGPPSADGKISGIVNFLAIHETYHGGQLSYIRSWLGYKGLMG